ncbi:MAG: hypothetical protein M3271_07720 [Actinomycetota bacterium]|nr:hypothetical protein [Actinomycetota bacterium]
MRQGSRPGAPPTGPRRLAAIAIVGCVCAGLFIAGRGLVEGVPVVFFRTAEEFDRLEAGRELILWSTPLFGVAAAVAGLVARRALEPLAIASPIAFALVAQTNARLLALLLFAVTGLGAFVASIVQLTRPPSGMS